VEETKQILTQNMDAFRDSGQYIGILLLGFLFFVFLNFEKKLERHEKVLGMMGLLSFVLLMNPVFVFFYERMIPDSSHFMQLIFVIPLGILLPLFMVKALELVTEKRKKQMMVLGFLLIIMLSGTFFPYNKDLKIEQASYGIPKDVIEVLDFILEDLKEVNSIDLKPSLLGTDEIMEAARSYDSRFILPYGRDIIDGSRSYYIHDYNSQLMQDLYQYMLGFEDHVEEIFVIAENEQLQFVVFRDQVNETSGNWYYPKEGEKLILTQEIIMQLSLEFQETAKTQGLQYGYELLDYEGPYLVFKHQNEK
jgi:hypothetical protein